MALAGSQKGALGWGLHPDKYNPRKVSGNAPSANRAGSNSLRKRAHPAQKK